MPDTVSVDFDTCIDEVGGETIESIIAEMADLGIEATVVNPHGPGGGHPIVRYTGDKEAIKAMVREHFSTGCEEEDLPNIEAIDEGGWADQSALPEFGGTGRIDPRINQAAIDRLTPEQRDRWRTDLTDEERDAVDRAQTLSERVSAIASDDEVQA